MPAKSKNSPNTASRSRSNRKKSGFFVDVLELAGVTFIGRVFLALLVTAAIAGIDLLIIGNDYDLFFKMIGVELIVASIVFWIRFLLRKIE